MDIEKLAEQLAGLQFESGHVFDNGAPFYETLSKESAEGLLRALVSHGYELSRQDAPSPSTTAVSATTCTSRPPRPPQLAVSLNSHRI